MSRDEVRILDEPATLSAAVRPLIKRLLLTTKDLSTSSDPGS